MFRGGQYGPRRPFERRYKKKWRKLINDAGYEIPRYDSQPIDNERQFYQFGGRPYNPYASDYELSRRYGGGSADTTTVRVPTNPPIAPSDVTGRDYIPSTMEIEENVRGDPSKSLIIKKKKASGKSDIIRRLPRMANREFLKMRATEKIIAASVRNMEENSKKYDKEMRRMRQANARALEQINANVVSKLREVPTKQEMFAYAEQFGTVNDRMNILESQLRATTGSVGSLRDSVSNAIRGVEYLKNEIGETSRSIESYRSKIELLEQNPGRDEQRLAELRNNLQQQMNELKQQEYQYRTNLYDAVIRDAQRAVVGASNTQQKRIMQEYLNEFVRDKRFVTQMDRDVDQRRLADIEQRLGSVYGVINKYDKALDRLNSMSGVVPGLKEAVDILQNQMLTAQSNDVEFTNQLDRLVGALQRGSDKVVKSDDPKSLSRLGDVWNALCDLLVKRVPELEGRLNKSEQFNTITYNTVVSDVRAIKTDLQRYNNQQQQEYARLDGTIKSIENWANKTFYNPDGSSVSYKELIQQVIGINKSLEETKDRIGAINDRAILEEIRATNSALVNLKKAMIEYVSGDRIDRDRIEDLFREVKETQRVLDSKVEQQSKSVKAAFRTQQDDLIKIANAAATGIASQIEYQTNEIRDLIRFDAPRQSVFVEGNSSKLPRLTQGIPKSLKLAKSSAYSSTPGATFEHVPGVGTGRIVTIGSNTWWNEFGENPKDYVKDLRDNPDLIHPKIRPKIGETRDEYINRLTNTKFKRLNIDKGTSARYRTQRLSDGEIGEFQDEATGRVVFARSGRQPILSGYEVSSTGVVPGDKFNEFENVDNPSN